MLLDEKKIVSDISTLKTELRELKGLISGDAVILKSLEEVQRTIETHEHNARHSLPRHGIDIAWGNPDLTRLKSAGFSFIVRYYSYDPSKDINRVDAEDMSHHGFDCVTVWESTGMTPLRGYHQGVLDAKKANELANQVGQPHNSPIYFAADFDLNSYLGAQNNIVDYFRGCKDVLGSHRVGVYGGLDTVKLIHLRNEAAFLWQTLAWSKGVWYPHAQLRQTKVDEKIANVQADIDIAVASNFGQWKL